MLRESYTALLSKFYEEGKGALSKENGWRKLWEVGLPDELHESFRKIPLQTIFASGNEIRESSEFVVEASFNADGIELISLEEAMSTYGFFLQKRFEERVAKEDEFFALAADVLDVKGGFIYIPPGKKEPITLHIKHNFSSKSHYFQKLQIVVGSGSEVVIVLETPPGCHKESLIYELIDISCEKEAKCRFIDITSGNRDVVFMKNVRATLKRGSRLNYFTATSGSKLFRQSINFDLLEEGAFATARGVAHLKEKQTSHLHVKMNHLAPHATSYQHFKGVLEENAKSSFEGKIYVASEAQKTESYQLSNHLILGDKAASYVKPGLEIFADDVKASHGATITQLSEEEMFYLQTRGLNKNDISRYLAHGFLDGLVSKEVEGDILARIRRIYAV